MTQWFHLWLYIGKKNGNTNLKRYMPPNVYERKKVKVTQLCQTLCDPMDWILQTRILEWVAVPFSRDWTQVSQIAGGFFASWATREAQENWSGWLIPSPADLSNPGIEPGSPALQADSLPAELPGKHSSIVYNSQDTATIQVPIKRQTDEEGVLCPTPHNKITINI